MNSATCVSTSTFSPFNLPSDTALCIMSFNPGTLSVRSPIHLIFDLLSPNHEILALFSQAQVSTGMDLTFAFTLK